MRRQGCPLSFVKYCTYFPATFIKQSEKYSRIKGKKDWEKLSTFADGMTVYIQNSEEFIKQILELK